MVKVRIPASSANLGPGFDSLGIALGLYNTVCMEESDRLVIRSADGVSVPKDKTNLVFESAKYLYDLCGKTCPGFVIEQQSDIPMTRGLGSSSACIVGGLTAANALLGAPLSTAELVDIAAALEGHPDNTAPALLGGFVVAVLEAGKVTYFQRTLFQEDLCFGVLIPNVELSTGLARAALPRSITRGDAVYNLSRAALLVAALLEQRLDFIPVAAKDALHQTYRMKYIPGGERVSELAEASGALATVISGAGSALLSFVRAGDRDRYEETMRTALTDPELGGWRLLMLNADNQGASVIQSVT